MGRRVVGPPEHVAVERRGAVGVGRPHRDVADVAVLDRRGGSGHRSAEHPAMPERVDDRGVAGAVVLVGLPLNVGAAVPGPFQRRVGVGDVQHQAHRSRLRARRFQPELGVLVGEVEHAVRRSPARRARCGRRPSRYGSPTTDSAEGVDVPGDGVARVGDRQVRQRGGPRGSGRDGLGGGLVEFGDGGIGATHDNSLRSIGQGDTADSRRARRRAANAGSGWTGSSSPCSTVSGSWLLFMTSLLPAPGSEI